MIHDLLSVCDPWELLLVWSVWTLGRTYRETAAMLHTSPATICRTLQDIRRRIS